MTEHSSRRWWSTRRFDFLEVALIAGGLIAATLLITAYASGEDRRVHAFADEGLEELAALERQYGPQHYSRYGEEWIVRDFFRDRRDGVFVDVGASDYQRENNTYFLETALGWSGVAIDAQREYAAGYEQHRPRTRFFSLFVSDVTDAKVDFYIPKDRRLNASGTREVAAGSPTETREMPTVTLDDLLTRVGISHVDFVSMDIELAEPKALAGFDIERFGPALVCIESHPLVRQAILNYFSKHRYVVVGKYVRTDTENLYFTPDSTVADAGRR